MNKRTSLSKAEELNTQDCVIPWHTAKKEEEEEESYGLFYLGGLTDSHLSYHSIELVFLIYLVRVHQI